MLALENLEVLVEECSIGFKLLLTRDLSLAVVGCIDQMVEQVLLPHFWLVLPEVCDDFLDLLLSREAGPHDELELAEH